MLFFEKEEKTRNFSKRIISKNCYLNPKNPKSKIARWPFFFFVSDFKKCVVGGVTGILYLRDDSCKIQRYLKHILFIFFENFGHGRYYAFFGI